LSSFCWTFSAFNASLKSCLRSDPTTSSLYFSGFPAISSSTVIVFVFFINWSVCAIWFSKSANLEEALSLGEETYPVDEPVVSAGSPSRLADLENQIAQTDQLIKNTKTMTVDELMAGKPEK
jgi:hypothetical protein